MCESAAVDPTPRRPPTPPPAGLAHPPPVSLAPSHACAADGFQGACGSFEPFRRAFPSSITIALEQNYRSSGAIVAASSALIRLNRARTPKHCFTAKALGAPLVIAECRSVADELGFVTGRIRALLRSSAVRPAHVAVLFRTARVGVGMQAALEKAELPFNTVRRRRP